MTLPNGQKRRLKAVYRWLIKRARKTLAQYYSDTVTNQIMADTRTEGENVIDRLPYVGKKNLHTPVINLSGLIVAFYKAMKRIGASPEEAVYIVRETCERLINRIPKPIGRLIGKLAFSTAGQRMFDKQAALSQKKQYPEDFVFQAEIIHDNSVIAIATVFSECAVHKLFERERVPELKPYCNFFDPLFSARFGMGVDSNHTFAKGCDMCRLAFHSNRETKTPENISAMMDKAADILNAHKA